MTKEIYVLDNGVKRLATKDEVAQYEADTAAFLQQKTEDERAADEKVALRDATLTKLGLTADEVAALLG